MPLVSYHVYIVPKATPNADSHAIQVEVDFGGLNPEKVRGWAAMERLLAPHIPADHFMTGYARTAPLTAPQPLSTVAVEPVPAGQEG